MKPSKIGADYDECCKMSKRLRAYVSCQVMIAAALEDIPRAQFSYNFDYEHQIVQRLESGNTVSSSTVSFQTYNAHAMSIMEK